VSRKTCIRVAAVFLALSLLLLGVATAGTRSSKNEDKGAAAVTASDEAQDNSMRLEGEKRFHSNCGRCHAAPPKFSPRVTGTILRHMRVRAMLTDEDTRLILRYMTR
jgi:mono/diheme cytochrome c family protein